jgi:fimbrial chaperone protein
MPSSSLRVVLACAAVIVAAPGARAADLSVSPVLVELASGGETALLTIENVGRNATRFEVKAFAWAQDSAGQMKLLPSKDLFVYPPLVELAPGEARNLRVGTSATQGEIERAWRVSVEEMPRADAPQAGTQIRVLTRIGLPVFLAPRGAAQARGEIAFVSRDGKRIAFSLRNTGNVRLRPLSVKLALVSATGQPVFEKRLDAWYVLARDEVRYDVEVPADACAKAAEVIVTAALEAGAVEGRARGACLAP